MRLIAQEAVKRKLVRNMAPEAIRVLLQSHDLKPWREKMWCVATLDEEHIRRMEDVLALYEKLLSEEEPVDCIDEKPVVLHRDLRTLGQDTWRGAIMSTSVVAQPIFFVVWSRRLGGISPKPHLIAARPSSPITWRKSSPVIHRPERFIWFWTA